MYVILHHTYGSFHGKLSVGLIRNNCHESYSPCDIYMLHVIIRGDIYREVLGFINDGTVQ